MHVSEFKPSTGMHGLEPLPIHEAEENLRVIRDLMERSTRYSTFSGLSGVCAGLVSILGCLIQRFWVESQPADLRTGAFLVTWTAVTLLAIGIDYALTKRRAPLVGKTINSRLGRQMALASIPGLGAGAILTLFLLRHGLMSYIFGFWMLAYGIAVSAVALFSQREVRRLGLSFLAAGALTVLLQSLPGLDSHAGGVGLVMMAVAFGGLHILYGVGMARRGGW